MAAPSFEWDAHKDAENQAKHGVPFVLAQTSFADAHRVIAEDTAHSANEQRYFCFGRVGDAIMTVRFMVRAGVIRIFGAGYWRQAIYDRENQNHE